MTKILIYLLLSSFLLQVSARLPLKWNRLHRYRNLTNEQSKLTANPGDQYFTQKLDHFNSIVSGTWKQRYWQNDQYYKDGDLQFLYIGGEGEESPYSISNENTPIVAWAKKLGARLWNLEHRYYGKSHPTSDQSIQNLQYLNSRQALEDLGEFIKAKNSELSIKEPKWIVFGVLSKKDNILSNLWLRYVLKLLIICSYAGSLALWFRQRHPELTIGAISSSAPMELTTDFFDYLRVCEDSYRSYNYECSDNIKIAFESLHNLLNTKEGRDQVDKAFKFNPPLSKQTLTYTNLQHFYITIMENFMISVQYSRINSGVFKTDASIPDICKIMGESNVELLTRLSNVNAYIEKVFDENPAQIDNSYSGKVKALQDISFDSPYSSSRSWTYQTCNEFGFFQSTNYVGIFGPCVPIDYYYNLCSDVFETKFNVDYIRGRVQTSIDIYGNKDYNATNVVILNGNIDPWHALGVYSKKNPTVVTYLITGTAHCSDMEPSSDNDPVDLKYARNLIYQNLQSWIGIKSSRSSRKIEEKQEKLKTRCAPDFDAKICWGCGKPQNNHLKPRITSSVELKARFEKSTILGRPSEGGFLGLVQKEGLEKIAINSIEPNYIEQPVDHFNSSDKRTYQQVFYSNDQFYKKGGPIFLFIGGESKANAYWISNKLPLTEWAKKYHGWLFEVEHRFYGDSQPTENMHTDNLKYLTSEQALADLATFVKQINKDKGLKNPRWISYGGSYSGSLSAWFREIYPDITFAAIGSSGPVEAKVDFYGYLQTVQTALKFNSDECANNLGNAFNEVQQLLTTYDGRLKLNGLLKVQPPFDKQSISALDVFYFFSDIMNPIMRNVQYSDSYHGAVNKICNNLTDSYTKSLVSRLQNVKGNTPTYRDFYNILYWIQMDGDTRAWIWQTCNEFGFYQSSDMGYNAFGSSVPLNYYLPFCTNGYDSSLNRDKLEKSIAATNQKYGGARNYKSKRVIQIYNSADPWHTLGFFPVNGSNGEDVISIMIEGTSHCSDMTRAGDQTKINKALDQVDFYLNKWINSSCIHFISHSYLIIVYGIFVFWVIY